VAKRQENLLSISKEIENIKTYKLQERSILHTGEERDMKIIHCEQTQFFKVIANDWTL
jgi:hypothetical protein